MPQMKMSDWLEIAANFPDQAAAEQFRIANNIQIVDTGDKPAGGLSAVTKQAAETQNAGPQSEEETLRAQLIGYPAKKALEREQQFKDAQARIAQSYAGPSVSQQLFALSKALLSPKKYSGFAGTMANVSSALSDVAKSSDEAKQKRALAEMQLRNAYDTAASGDELKAMQLRYQLVKEANDKIAAANKPQWARTEDPVTGEITLTPVYANSQQASSDIDPADLKTLFTNPTKLPLPRLIELFNGRYGAGRAEKLLGVK